MPTGMALRVNYIFTGARTETGTAPYSPVAKVFEIDEGSSGVGGVSSEVGPRVTDKPKERSGEERNASGAVTSLQTGAPADIQEAPTREMLHICPTMDG